MGFVCRVFVFLLVVVSFLEMLAVCALFEVGVLMWSL
jgi:hypothetical protein